MSTLFYIKFLQTEFMNWKLSHAGLNLSIVVIILYVVDNVRKCDNNLFHLSVILCTRYVHLLLSNDKSSIGKHLV